MIVFHNMSTNNSDRKRSFVESDIQSEQDSMTGSESSSKRNSKQNRTRDAALCSSDRFCRSVNHYTTEIALKNALSAVPHDSQTTAKKLDPDDDFGTHDYDEHGSVPTSIGLKQDDIPIESHNASTQTTIGQAETNKSSASSIELCDWRLPSLGAGFVEQSVESEIRRLLVLKSYDALDRNTRAMDLLTTLAGNVFDCKYAFVSLMDLGRLFFIGSNGSLENVPYIPRKVSFCAYTMLLAKDDDVFVIPDTLADVKSASNPFVTDPVTSLRFYAGTPLVGPEGVRLGTFAVLDPTARPNGMSEKEKNMLRSFAKLAVENLVTSKALQLQTKQVEKSAQMLACAANDLLTPLTGVQLSLSLLREDLCSSNQTANEKSKDLEQKQKSENISLKSSSRSHEKYKTPLSTPTCSPDTQSKADHRLECLATATTCANIMVEICETLRPSSKNAEPSQQTIESTTTTQILDSALAKSSSTVVEKTGQECQSNSRISGSMESQIDVSSTLKSVCDITILAQRLKTVVDVVPKQVPVVVTVDKAVPNLIVADELPIFRAALNLLAASCDRSNTGKIVLTVSVTNECGLEYLGTDKGLLFECIDSGPAVSIPEPNESDTENDIITSDGKIKMKTSQSVLLQSFNSSTLSSVSALVRSIGGDFGVTALDAGSLGLWKSISGSMESTSTSNGSRLKSRMLSVAPTTKFWFKIPLFVPEEGNTCRQNSSTIDETPNGTNKSDDKTTATTTDTISTSNLPATINMKENRRKLALVIDDSVVIRKTLTRALAGLGYDTSQAENGHVGLETMKEQIFDIVLCDFLMPVMDGMDCIREYREWENTNRVGYHQYVVGMSAHASSKDAERAIKVGMDRYVPKPIFLPHLKKLTEDSTNIDSSDKILIGKIKDDEISLQPSVKTTLATIGVSKHICLIGAKGDTCRMLEGTARENGFFVLSCETGEELIQLLKARNWAVVMADETILEERIGNEPAAMDNKTCLQIFREWEKQYRVHRQKNVYMICSSMGSSQTVPDEIDFPAGTDGVLGHSIDPESLSKIFQRCKVGLPFSPTDIVTSS